MTNESNATPVGIDTELASHYRTLMLAEHAAKVAETIILGYAGMREWVRPANRGRGYYQLTGTFAEARAKIEAGLAAYDAEIDLDYDAMSELAKSAIGHQDYARRQLADRDASTAIATTTRGEIARLDEEFNRRGGWTRKFLVTSSAGHLHSSMHCSTCRPTTTYGWWPQLSGLTETEAIAALEDRADALCSVCFPTAPVAAKRTNITKAQAAKLAA